VAGGADQNIKQILGNHPGSLAGFDFQFPIANFQLEPDPSKTGNWQSAIGNVFWCRNPFQF
jgi:hypothetical protein